MTIENLNSKELITEPIDAWHFNFLYLKVEFGSIRLKVNYRESTLFFDYEEGEYPAIEIGDAITIEFIYKEDNFRYSLFGKDNLE